MKSFTSHLHQVEIFSTFFLSLHACFLISLSMTENNLEARQRHITEQQNICTIKYICTFSDQGKRKTSEEDAQAECSQLYLETF